MSVLPDDYLRYPHRRPGLDHDWFDRGFLKDAAPVAWPGGARIALWITVHLEHYPMTMSGSPFMPAGGMLRPYPSYWDYTSRDYGNRVGFFRIARALDARGLSATAAMNSAVAVRYPPLMDEITGRGWTVMASGVDMGALLHGGLTADQEQAIIAQSVGELRQASGQAVTGWVSPAGSGSMRTLDLLAAAGITHVGDWHTDDMPFALRSAAGPLHAVPICQDRADKRIMVEFNQSEDEYERQIMAAFAMLHAEAGSAGGRLFSLPVTPWVSGQPFRIATLERVLDRILSHGDVWVADAPKILHACGV